MDRGNGVRKRLQRRSQNSERDLLTTTGFTLMEVVVAMAILGVALTVIIELFSGGLRLAKTSAEYTKAINYARMKMEEIAVKQTIEEGTQEGEFDHTFRWQVETKKVDVLPIEKGIDFIPPTELFQVKVNVLWKSGSRERSTRLETYRTIKLEDKEKQS